MRDVNACKSNDGYAELQRVSDNELRVKFNGHELKWRKKLYTNIVVKRDKWKN